jgi:O-Antigen ligase
MNLLAKPSLRTRQALGAAFALALTTGLAFDAGGFHALSWDRGLVGLVALALVVVLLARVELPGRLGSLTLGALALLTAWTAASWLWSDSPPAALQEAQRVALYLAVVVVVVVVGRRVPPGSLAAGVVAAATATSVWNLAIRLAPDWSGRGALRTDIGQLADPIGYANSLALLAVLGLLLVLGMRGPALAALVPLAAALVLQQSAGALAALAAGLLVYAMVSGRPLRVLALCALPAVGALLVGREHAVVDPPSTNLLAAAHAGHRLLLLLALLTVAQAALAYVPLPAGPRLPLWIAAAAAAAALVAAPFAFQGHERGAYWRVAGHEVRANLALGSGAGTFVDWWLRLRTQPRSTLEAHSLYLETLAELGPLGLALLLVALGAPLLAAWRLRSSPWVPPILAALVAYDLGAAVDFHWELPAVTVPAILLGASVAVHADKPRGAVSRGYMVPVLATLGTAGVLALAGNAALDAGNPQQALRFAPYSSQAWTLLGDQRRARGDSVGARDAYRHAIELDRNDWSAWRRLADVSTGESRRSAAAEAARLNPLAGG